MPQTRERHTEYMRVYRKSKKVESKVAERVLAEHLRIQSIADYELFLSDPETFKVEKLRFAEKMKTPSVLNSVLDAVLKKFPLTGKENRWMIEAIVYRKYALCQSEPEAVKYETFWAKRTIARLHNQLFDRRVEKAQQMVNVLSMGLPEKKELYVKGQVLHSANCLRELKEQGYDYYVAFEACGPRFYDKTDFWPRGWLPEKLNPLFMARLEYAGYDVGPKYFVEAEKAGVDVDFIKEWRMEDHKRMKEIEDSQLEWAKSVYETSRNSKTYERLVSLFVKQGFNDNQILERLESAGVTGVIDPSYIRAKMPEVRKEAEKRLRFDIEEKILTGILQGLGNDEIAKTVLSEFIIHKDELQELVMLIRKSMREEISSAEEKVLTKAIRIKHRIKIKA